MDSFYDAPRRPPVPTKLDPVTKVAIVPEVSMINLDSNLSAKTKTTNYYDSISLKRFAAAPVISQQNTLPQYNLPRKQVHFETPSRLNSSNGFAGCNNNPYGGGNFNLNGETFQQIYMANIPNRHLDLSILEPKCSNQNNLYKNDRLQTPTVFQEPSRIITGVPEMPRNCSENVESPKFRYEPFEESNGCCCKSDFAFKPQKNNFALPTPKINEHIPLRSIENTQFRYDDGSRNAEVEKWKNDSNIDRDPSFRDLFEIVKKQNEQIMLLQEQVSSLKNCITSTGKDKISENIQVDPRSRTNSPRRALPKKFSIDLKATSFEVSFRPQQKYRKHQGDFCEPKIEEIIESGTGKNVDRNGASNELVFNLQESINVHETCPSPPPSIQINMQDYDSSNDEETGMTLYEDIMDQVNNMLDKVQIESSNGHQSSPITLGSSLPNTVKGHTIREAKEATLNYLKSIGVNVPYRNDVFKGTGTSAKKMGYSPSEVSFAVKQLLLKYLPDEHLTKITCNQAQAIEKSNAGPAGSEFSFATIQYMKKYNLLNRTKPRHSEVRRKTAGQQDGEMPQILDIATLKLQPKLL